VLLGNREKKPSPLQKKKRRRREVVEGVFISYWYQAIQLCLNNEVSYNIRRAPLFGFRRNL